MEGGIVFPKTFGKSSTAFGKAAFAAAAQALGREDLATAITREKDWRHKYAGHVGALHEAQVQADAATALSSFRAGLAQACALDVEAADGTTKPLAEALQATPASPHETAVIAGEGGPQPFQVPFEYRGLVLQNEALDQQLDTWQTYGCMEPDCAQAIRSGVQEMEALVGRTFVVVGAFSEMGPLRHLLRAGATVAALARRKAEDWQRYAELIEFTKTTRGKLLLPVQAGASQASVEEIARAAGVDLLSEPVAAADWIKRIVRNASGPVTVGTYIYVDGANNVTATAAADVVVDEIAKAGHAKNVSFAWLASPTTATAISDAAAKGQQANLANLNWWQRALFATNLAKPLTSKCGRDICVMNNLSVMQGPNYALAQHMRQWRAMLLSAEGFVVSTPMAPVARTLSVTKNRTMATVLDGMARAPPLEAFHPETASALLFALMVSDLIEPPCKSDTPFEPLIRKSFHSGVWRYPLSFESAGKLLFVLGKVAAKDTPH